MYSQDQHKLRCLVVLTKECIVNRHIIEDLILFSCQPVVICIASSLSYASLTPSSVRCVRHSVAPALALSADSEVVLERTSRLPLLSRPLHLHDAPPSLFMGCLCTWYHMGCCYLRIQPLTHSLVCRLPPDNVRHTSIFGGMVLSCFTPFSPNLFVWAPFFGALVSCCRFVHSKCIRPSW